jgi:hypothetical protein
MAPLVKEAAGIFIAAVGIAIIGVASPFAATTPIGLLGALGFSFIGLIVLVVGLRFVWVSGF